MRALSRQAGPCGSRHHGKRGSLRGSLPEAHGFRGRADRMQAAHGALAPTPSLQAGPGSFPEQLWSVRVCMRVCADAGSVRCIPRLGFLTTVHLLKRCRGRQATVEGTVWQGWPPRLSEAVAMEKPRRAGGGRPAAPCGMESLLGPL